eukprot:s942_g11.t1
MRSVHPDSSMCEMHWLEIFFRLLKCGAADGGQAYEPHGISPVPPNCAAKVAQEAVMSALIRCHGFQSLAGQSTSYRHGNSPLLCDPNLQRLRLRLGLADRCPDLMVTMRRSGVLELDSSALFCKLVMRGASAASCHDCPTCAQQKVQEVFQRESESIAALSKIEPRNPLPYSCWGLSEAGR